MPWLDPSTPSLPFQSTDTSHEAAVRAQAFAGRQQRQYRAWLENKGTHGGTDAEAETELGMRRSSVCARRNELVKAGLVIDAGTRRGGCAVWVCGETTHVR